MNLSKASVKGLGVLASAALVLGTGILVINPLLEHRNENLSSLTSLQKITETKKANLSRLSSGSVNFNEASKVGDNFLRIVPKDKNIESASRAISEALVPGVTITSFTFGSEEAAAPTVLPKVGLEGYKAPASFAAAAATGSAASKAPAAAAGSSSTLNRLPMTVSVSATSYQNLSTYIDQLSKEDRLVSVISINASSKSGTIVADIYAYAFIDKTP